MLEEKKKKDFKDSDKLVNVFAEGIEIVVNNETAHLRFGLSNKDGDIVISHNVIITIPHLYRLTDALKFTVEKLTNQIETNDNSSL